MSGQDLVKYAFEQNIVIDSPNAEKYGKNIYTSNRVMRDIATVMEHPEMRHFIEKYMISDKNDATATIKMLQTYKKIDTYCNSRSIRSAYVKIAILYELYRKSEYRRMILK